MPVTARLSLKFYEKLGEDVTNELVEWFNQVDATYHSNLRELNESNFARFDAKLDQRIAQLGATFEQRLAQLDVRIAEVAAELRREIAITRGELRAELHRELGAAKAELIKWAFVFWVPTALGVIGLYFKG